MEKKSAFVAFVLMSVSAACAAVAPFAPGERVTFLGDSITHGGIYHVNLQLFWDLRFPGSGTRLMNCGVSGGTAAGGLKRWNADVLPQQADRIFVMFGMNDVGHGFYKPGIKTDAALMARRAAQLAAYRTNMVQIADAAAAAGKRLVLITPTPYDEYGNTYTSERRVGCNEQGLASFAACCRELAAERHAELLELYAPLTAFVKEQTDFKLCRNDRVHPTPVGHMIMTAMIVEALGVSPEVAHVEIAADGTVARTVRAEVSDISVLRQGLRFRYAPEALPYPVTDDYRAADAAYPVTTRMNMETLKVTGLAEGRYELQADGKQLGVFTAAELAEGVNLALLPTPGARLAQTAWNISRRLASLQSRLRTLVQMEAFAADRGARMDDFADVCAKAEAAVQKMKASGSSVANYYAAQLASYRKDKPQAGKLRAEEDECRRQLAAACAKKAPCKLEVRRVLSAPPDEARIAAIMAALPEEPGGPTPYDAARPADIRAAEALLDQPVPDLPDELYLEFSRNGNRTHYQKANGRRTSAAHRLAMAECAERKGRFIPKLAEYLDKLADQRSWVLPAHDLKLNNFNGTRLTIDLVSSHRAAAMAEMLTALKGRLPETTVRHVMVEMRRRVFDLYLADTTRERPSHGWWFGDSNWNAVCHAGVVRAALLILPDRLERARIVEAAMRAQSAYLTGFTPDGYCSEGMGYWSYGFGNYLRMGLAIRAATNGRFDLFREGGERARAAAAYPFAFQLQKGVSPRFADGGGNPSKADLDICRAIWPGLGRDELPLRSAFPYAQVFFFRAGGAETRPFAAAVKGGNNAELHNHNDVGTWTLMLDGVELAGDPGGEEYTARTFSSNRYVSAVLNSFGHPVPRVAGKLQPAGGRFRAKVLKTDFSDGRDVVQLDLAGAYDAAGLQRLVRTVTFDRAARTFTVADEVAFTAPAAFDVPIITYCAVTRGETPAAFTLTAEKGKGRSVKAAVDIAVTGGEWDLKEEDIVNPGRATPKRLAVAFRQPVAQATVAFTFKEEK